MNPGSPLTQNSRFFYLDNLKTLVILLVVLSHVAMSFGPIDGWYYYENNYHIYTTFFMYWFVAVNQAFAMGLMFMLSGYFTPPSCRKRGAIHFLGNRLKKLMIPFAIYVLLVSPFLNYMYQIYNTGLKQSFFDYYHKQILHLNFNGSGPMWFVFVLMAFSVVYALFHAVTKNRIAPKPQKPVRVPRHRTIVLFVVLMSLATFAVRLAFPINRWFNLLNVTLIDFSHITQYICIFIIGILCWRYNWLQSIPNQLGKTWFRILLAAIFIWPAIMLLGGLANGVVDPFLGGFSWQSLAYCFWESFVCVGAAIGLVWKFREKLSQANTFTVKLANTNFTVYLTHAPILLGISILFSFIKIYPFVKFVFLAAFSVGICFSTAICMHFCIEWLKSNRFFYNNRIIKNRITGND